LTDEEIEAFLAATKTMTAAAFRIALAKWIQNNRAGWTFKAAMALIKAVVDESKKAEVASDVPATDPLGNMGE
jgi:hypothetical protein